MATDWQGCADAVEALLDALTVFEGYLLEAKVPDDLGLHMCSTVRTAVEAVADDLDDYRRVVVEDQGRVFVMFRTDRANRTYSVARCSVRTPNKGHQAPLPHLVHHSPDGFEWGYNGSGPADLARSIVGLILRESIPHPLLYQAVKQRCLSMMPEEGGEVTEAEVRKVMEAAKVDRFAP